MSTLTETSPERALALYRETRAQTRRLVEPLSAEDQQVQSMPDASPTKWHLAHTTWYVEAFVLGPHQPGYAPYDPAFHYLFNSYYDAHGARHPRPRRGLLTRPGLGEVQAYRDTVDERVERFVAGPHVSAAALSLLELGCYHEGQHQELILTDVLHAFGQSPLRPAYDPSLPDLPPASAPAQGWIEHPGGRVELGHTGGGFAFDNEGPRHAALLRPFRLASRAVTQGEWLAFMDAGGYAEPGHWLADGWARAQSEGWEAPLYWRRSGDDWETLTLAGPTPIDPAAPVCHVSFYEADAFARWAGHRLPTEAEWEAVAAERPVAGNLLRASAPLRPRAARDHQLFGDVWEWTASPYAAYPGYRPPSGAVGEYNGKFMCNQLVLRGGSCLTPVDHVRATYRNFFYPHMRWQMSGLRLASDA